MSSHAQAVLLPLSNHQLANDIWTTDKRDQLQVHDGKKSIFAFFRESLLRETRSQMMMLSVKQCKLNKHFVKKNHLFYRNGLYTSLCLLSRMYLSDGSYRHIGSTYPSFRKKGLPGSEAWAPLTICHLPSLMLAPSSTTTPLFFLRICSPSMLLFFYDLSSFCPCFCP